MHLRHFRNHLGMTPCSCQRAVVPPSARPVRQAACRAACRPFSKRRVRLLAAAAEAAPNAAAPPPPAGLPQADAALDDELSRRPLELDAAGYFIIKVDREARELVADFYTNFINEQGLACDPATGEVISCKPGATRLPARSWRGRTAKAVAVELLEAEHGFQPVTRLEHAAYLGRELQRAELALVTGHEYVQD